MSDDYLSLSYGQLGASVLLIIINVALSVQLRLGLEHSLAIASLRCVVQLLLVGYILEWLFALDNPWVVLAIALLMAAIAGISAVNRTSRRFAGIYWRSLLSVLVSALLITNLSVIGIIQVQPWYNPQYLIPLLGMILGNTLNGISLGLDRFMEGVVSNRNGIETLLALGATRWEASHKQIQTAVRTGMIPMINSMMVMGVVSLPGMMTGQILAGASPLDAVRYQIVIIFAIASASALGTLGVVILAWLALFSPSHQLLSDRLDQITKK
ncbi:iron export ABC transporter permease subunit FetB [Limnospira fusiformis KN01]|uniref:ABC transporter permease n=1 Tax=Limnospira TaxID=2596745 RepID=UPI00165899A4|nr:MULTISPECIES: iron export ABC transporter permease subunit FetB [Limnospira]MDT9200156.1 iron export ABC transporter permease subunit FetB [Limnospira sp. PMC 1042.18]ULB46230.1 iron export ABC transporter permease subunit FetB [Limnospira fusiformis KN01]